MDRIGSIPTAFPMLRVAYLMANPFSSWFLYVHMHKLTVGAGSLLQNATKIKLLLLSIKNIC